MTIDVTWYTDPGCPWAYSANPPLSVLRWRYGSQLKWRIVTIGLTEDGADYESRGFTPARAAQMALMFRRYGMPFAPQPRSRMLATARGCRAIVATRLLDPERELAVHRTLQLAWFNTTLMLDRDEDLVRALEHVPGLDAAAVVATLDDESVTEAYRADHAEARSALGGATEFQGKAAVSDGLVRYTAPSLIFELDGRRLEGGGFQPIEAYDVLIANLDPKLDREPPPESPLTALQRLPYGLVTQEVAAIMAAGNEAPDRRAAEAALIELTAQGAVQRTAVGDDAVWELAGAEPGAAFSHAAVALHA